MRDVITIAIILSLAVIVPLVLRLFTNNDVAPLEDSGSHDGPSDENGRQDPNDDEWPSIIEVGDLQLNFANQLEEDAIALAMAEDRLLRLFR